MRVAIYDLDTKKEKMGHGKTERFPNLACGQIYGYHKLAGDEVIYPWNEEPVDRLYVSAIFSWTEQAIRRLLPRWELVAKEIVIGGTGWDWRSKLPPEIEAVDPKWAYEMYDIDYGIGFTVRGCHVGCSFCVVPRKEGTKEYRVSTIADLINPRSKHVVLLNNNSFAEAGFFDDVAEIRDRGLTVNWNQANDITLLEPRHAEAVRSVKYRNFNNSHAMLYFACDQMIRRKRHPITGETVEYDMMQVVPERIRMLKEAGVPPHHLNFYLLIGFDTTLEEDMARFHMLSDLGCDVYAMMFRDLKGRVGVDGRGKPQSVHVKPFRDWINGHVFRRVPFVEFDRYVRAQRQTTLELV